MASQPQNVRLHRFGVFEVDLQARELRKGGLKIKIYDQPFQILATLLEHPGEIVSREELRQKLWPADTFVDFDHSLNTAVNKLREALGDSADSPRFIETVPRRGYRLLCPVDPQVSHTHAQISVQRDQSVQNPVIGGGHKWGAPVRVAASAAGLIGIGFALYHWLSSAHSVEPFQTFEIRSITTSGNAVRAAISPDGRHVVYALAEGGKQSLWMSQSATPGTVRIILPSEVQYWGLTFSRDGNFVYYVRLDRSSHQDLFNVPALGGVSKKLAQTVHSPVATSPDGKWLAFVRGTTLMAIDADGKAERKLAERNYPEVLNRPAWSPDGTTVACTVLHYDPGSAYYDLLAVPVAGGEARPIAFKKWCDGDAVQWVSTGEGLILNAAEGRTDPLQIWYMPYAKGKPRRITNNLSNYTDLSLTADSRALLTIQSDRRSNIWVMPNPKATASKQVTPTLSRIDSLAWTPDGKIVYESGATHYGVTGAADLWIMRADGSESRPLTINAGTNNWPRVTSDGRYIVFNSDRTGNNHVWRMDLDGSNPKQLTNGVMEWLGDCSPDGTGIIYISADHSLWKISMDGGAPVRLTGAWGAGADYWPSISPDGSTIAYIEPEVTPPNRKRRIALMAIQGSPPKKFFDLDEFSGGPLRWTPDGQALTYMKDQGGTSNLFNQPIAGGPPKQLTDFRADRIFWFDWSRDGDQLALVRGLEAKDVVLIRDSGRR